MTPEEVKKEIVRLERILAGQTRFPNTIKLKLKHLRYIQNNPRKYRFKLWLSDVLERIGTKLWESED